MNTRSLLLLAFVGLFVGTSGLQAADAEALEMALREAAAKIHLTTDADVNRVAMALKTANDGITDAQEKITSAKTTLATLQTKIETTQEENKTAAAAAGAEAGESAAREEFTEKLDEFGTALQTKMEAQQKSLNTAREELSREMKDTQKKYEAEFTDLLKKDRENAKLKQQDATNEEAKRALERIKAMNAEHEEKLRIAKAEADAIAELEAASETTKEKARQRVALYAERDRLDNEGDLYKEVVRKRAQLEEDAQTQDEMDDIRSNRRYRELLDEEEAKSSFYSTPEGIEAHNKAAERKALADLRTELAVLKLKDSPLYRENQARLMAERVRRAAIEAVQRKEEIRAKAEATQRVKNELELEMVELRQAQRLESEQQAHESKEKMFGMRWKNIQQMFSSMGSGLKDPKRLAYMALTIGGTAGLIYAMRLMFKQLEMYLNRPKLVRDTSKRGLFSKRKVMGPTFKDMVLSSDLEAKLKRVMQSATQAYVYGTNLPNVGLFGPPGTGKTMFIEALANESGMTYAKMTGGDVSALLSSGGKNIAVTEIHKLFDWLEANGPSVLLVDEADAFLKNGRDGKLSEGLTAAINAFLSRTGSSSNKVMVVFATNYPQSLDGAVQNRVSTWIHVDRPALPERTRLIKLSLQTLRKQGLGKKHMPVKIDGTVNDAFIDDLARRMSGFAGRDIKMKFMDTLERELARRGKFTVTSEVANEVLKNTMDQERDLARWTQGDRPDFNGIAEAMNADAA